MTIKEFQEAIREGIPDVLPEPKAYDTEVSHAPKRKNVLTLDEKKLALKNALRYFDPKHHKVLAPEFVKELEKYGRIYMYRFRPNYAMYAHNIKDYPRKSIQAASIMLMINNNLDVACAQHPHELIVYGGNGAAFQNWAQYRLVMKYLSEMTDEQTLVMYSGFPMGLYPSHKDAPRLVITNGMVIPNYSKQEDWEKFNTLGVSQYGQMTAGSFMYIGPQGIVHGTTITLLNAGRKIAKQGESLAGKLFISSGLGGMSGAQPKAGNISGCVSVVAEINKKAVYKRKEQDWVDEVIEDIDKLIERVRLAKANKEVVSIAYVGNIVDIWERFAKEDISVELGSDQTSLHNPWEGGYYPVDMTFEESNGMISENPTLFKERVQASLRRQVEAINKCVALFGTYFFDYGNAFLLESSRAGADILKEDGKFKYSSYVQDIMGPMFFDYGFGPFRWVCTSCDPKDLAKTDEIAARVLKELKKNSPKEIQQQMQDNIHWIEQAGDNHLVVGSQARILYADEIGRVEIAAAFNDAIASGEITAPIVLGRDHHDVSGTDSPFRETSNIYDGSQFTADMAVQNVIGDSFRGATWVSIHNGGGVGWGEVINGGFGLLIDGSKDAERRLKSMLYWDVNNGISRRSWARNDGAIFAAKRAMKANPDLKITLPNLADDSLIDGLF